MMYFPARVMIDPLVLFTYSCITQDFNDFNTTCEQGPRFPVLDLPASVGHNKGNGTVGCTVGHVVSKTFFREDFIPNQLNKSGEPKLQKRVPVSGEHVQKYKHKATS